MFYYLKRLLFFFAILWAKLKWRLGSDDGEPTRPVFIWKDFYFFMWHQLFWAMGRWALSRFMEVKPMLGELGEAYVKQHAQFTELASRDYRALSFNAKIMHPSRYRLAPDTAEALCLLYAFMAKLAPWQYGLEARMRARKIMRNFFFFSLLAFLAYCNIDIDNTKLSAWIGLITFFSTLGSLSGWYASSSLFRIAREADQLCGTKKET